MKKSIKTIVAMLVLISLCALPVKAAEYPGMISDEEQTSILELLKPQWKSISENYSSSKEQKGLTLSEEDIRFDQSYRLNILNKDIRDVSDPVMESGTTFRYEVLVGEDTRLLIDENNGQYTWIGTQYGGNAEDIIDPAEVEKLTFEKFGDTNYQTFFVRVNSLMMDVAFTVDETGQKWVLPYSRFLNQYGLEHEYITWDEYVGKLKVYLEATEQATLSLDEPSGGGIMGGSSDNRNPLYPVGAVLIVLVGVSIFFFRERGKE